MITSADGAESSPTSGSHSSSTGAVAPPTSTAEGSAGSTGTTDFGSSTTIATTAVSASEGTTVDATGTGTTMDATGTTMDGTTDSFPDGTSGGGGEPPKAPDNATDENLLVALVGDQGTGSPAKAVYELMLAEQADLVILLGDYDYDDDPATWEAEMNAALPAEFPVFGLVGNHDVKEWSSYQAVLEQRLAQIPGAVCEGDLGVQSSCVYRGLHFVLSGLGTVGSDADHEAYIADALAVDDSLWSLCALHKNMRDLQAGDKPDDLTWEALQSCQAHGAIIAMGHEHSYARTRTLTDIGDKAAGHGAVGDPALLEVGPGSTFSVCSGLGGRSIRAYESLHDDETWWGSIYSSNRRFTNGLEVDDFEAAPGVLFLRFNVGGVPGAAHGYFKNVAGEIVDEFDVVHE